MATNTSLLHERLAETRATAEASMALRILTEMVNEPSTKRFAGARPSRVERWAQIAAVAQAQVSGLQALSRAAKRPGKPRALPSAAPVEAADIVPN